MITTAETRRQIPLRLMITMLVLLSHLVLTHPEAATYDLATDFSAQQNPNGVWSYGWSYRRGSLFMLDTISADYNDYGHAIGWWTPLGANVLYAITDYNVNWGGLFIPAGTVNINPGGNDNHVVIRWTSPVSGTYKIDGWFKNNQYATVDAAILHEATEIFTGAIDNDHIALPFSLTRQINAGETIDLTVGYGADESPNYDSTGIAVSVVAVPAETVPEDPTPPTVSCPNVSVPFSVEPTVPAYYPRPTIYDNLDPSPTVSYSIPSGSVFPVGTTTVTCTARDASGNSAIATFPVTRARQLLNHNYVLNGGFEDPIVQDQYIILSDSMLPYWTISYADGTPGGTVDIIDTYWEAAEGYQSIDLAGCYTAGRITQQLHLPQTPNEDTNYRLCFSIAENADRSNDKVMSVYCGESLLTSITHIQDGYTANYMGWTAYSFNVTARGPTTLAFADATPYPDNECGAALDNVSVAAVPMDNTPPTVFCPNVSVPFSVDPTLPVYYPPPTVYDDWDPSPTVTYSIPSGSDFSIGTTTVTCTAKDATGDSASTTFTVTRPELCAQVQTAWISPVPSLRDLMSRHLVLSSQNNVYISGEGETLKYDSDGNRLWSSAFTGAIEVDSAGNAYVAGEHISTNTVVEYGPTVKLDAANGMGIRTNDFAGSAIVLDSTGNVYITGGRGTIKFDADLAIGFWSNDLGGSVMALDGAGNAYVTGAGGTTKLDGYTGARLWINDFGGSAIAVDSVGDAYVAQGRGFQNS